MIRRSIAALALSFILLLPLTASPAAAQEWGQEAQLITQIQYGGPIHIFLDSLSAVLDNHPEASFRRSAEDKTTMRYADLQEQLYEDGIDLLSATHAFVRYRFDIRGRTRLVETVKDIYFIFRVDESESDIPILHISSSHPLISELLNDSGIASRVNMKSITPFRELLSFPNLSLHEDAALVEIGGRPIRGEFDREQGDFMDFLMEHTMANGGAYILRTPDRTVAVAGD